MKDKKDKIGELEEWQEHQYNPGYWIGRFSPQFPQKRTLGNWIINLIDVIMLVPTFFIVFVLYLIDRDRFYLMPLGVLGVFSILSVLRAIRLKPDLERSLSQVEMEEIRRKENKSKKRNLPKRRKDYS